MRYLALSEVLSLHSDLVAETGGATGVRDLGRIQAALAQPMATFDGDELYSTIVDKAAALGFALIQGHAFIFTDTGALCVRSEPDDKVSLSVVVDACASGCARISAATCELVVANTQLGLHSSIQVEEQLGPDVICPSGCVVIGVSCAAIPVSPGEYTIRHGDAVTTVHLPAEQPLLLGGGSAQAEVQCQ